MLVRAGFVSAFSTTTAVPSPNPVGTFTAATVFGAAPVTGDEDFFPILNVTEYVKPSPATSATYFPPPLIVSEANGTGAWYGNFL